jgi:CheY-like chemotaxis protein
MPSILCVDDDRDQLNLYHFFFERAGFEVILAGDGQEGVEKAKATRPSVILMDMMMPVKDGCQAAAEIKADPNLTHIPIILFTAYQTSTLTKQVAEAGVDLILSKTMLPQDLLVQIRDLLGIHDSPAALTWPAP